MRLLLARLLCLMLTGGSLCAIATCYRHDATPLQTPETRPAGPAAARTPDLPVRNRPSERPHWPMDATPAAVSPKKPPLDAGVDAIVPLPPVPDAAVPIVKDAATPM